MLDATLKVKRMQRAIECSVECFHDAQARVYPHLAPKRHGWSICRAVLLLLPFG